VKYPGSYVLKHNERLSELIERAGGLTDRAYPEASVITREIDRLVLDEQKKSMQLVKKLLEDLSQQEYQREIAKAQSIGERLGREVVESEIASGESVSPVLTSSPYLAGSIEEAAEAGAITSIPAQAEAAISGIEEITRPQYTLVTPARKIDSFLPSGRVGINLREAIAHPGVKDDIILQDGDAIIIPAMPATISVSGAVIQPSSLVYIKGKRVKDYIGMAGGYSRDADEDAVYVIKANGMAVREDKARLSPGDMIVVPTKVMVQKVTDRWAQVIGAVKFTVMTLATVYTIKLILGRV
jgi:protein involved in polysaccharide export with SLBB domain